MKFKIQFQGIYSSFQTYEENDLWNAYFYLARCYEPSNKKLVAWQMKCLWFVISIWFIGKWDYEIKAKEEMEER